MKTIGLIGCGAWGSNILRDLLSLGGEVYVVDIDAKARRNAEDKGARKAFSAIADLPPCNGYVVAVPIPDLAKECAVLLRYKKPIFSEKTLCRSLEDFHALSNAGGSDYIFAMHKWHYHPGIEALRLVAQSGQIGALKEICSTRHAWVKDFHGGDVFWTQAVHDLTIVKHILGYIPDQVRAVNVIRDEAGLPVSVSAMLGHDPAVILSVSGRHCNKISGVSIHGAEGSAMLHDALDDHITIRNRQGEKLLAIDTTFPLYLELKEFMNYLGGGPRPRCDLHSAWEVTEAILNLRNNAKLIQ